MGKLDLAKIRSRLNKLQNTKKVSNLTWKPTDKEQTIRIVPYIHQKDLPFIELYFYYNFGGKNYLSPISFNKPDPIYEAAQQLKNSGDKENWKMGKNLEPKLRTFAPIVVRGKEEEGIKFWGFGKTVYEQLLLNITDPDCGDITDPVTGRDIVVSTVHEPGKQFATPNVRIKMNSSKLTDSETTLKKIIAEQPNIKDLYELKTYEELKVILENYLNPEEEPGSETEQEQETTDETTDESTVNTVAESEEKETSPQKETATEDADNVKNLQSSFEKLFSGK